MRSDEALGKSEPARLAAGPSDAGPTAHAELLQERLLLRTLIDNLPDAIYVKDAACRKTLVPVE